MSTSFSEEISGIERIEKVTSGTDRDALQLQPTQRVAPDTDHFESLMQQGNRPENTVVSKDEATNSKLSLMDQVGEITRQAESIPKVSSKDLVAKTQELIAQIDEVKARLAQPEMEVKGSMQSMLKNKLTHIDENIQIALSKAGVEYTPAEKVISTPQTPIERFLGFLTDGESKLRTLGSEVEAMHLNNKEIAPANMLMIQMKVGYITQEIEFFSNLLNKALESTKTIMNIQV